MKPCFQSTPPRRRRRLSRSALPSEVRCFQSTPPRRRRRCNTARILSNAFFNPRLREGGDNSALSTLIRYKSFQSTPPRRRRRRRVFHSKRWMLFNPRLREGGDFYYAGNNVFTKLFNPRLREGGDKLSGAWLVEILFFQSTPPRRRRPFALLDACIDGLFSIHASAKEATCCKCSQGGG